MLLCTICRAFSLVYSFLSSLVFLFLSSSLFRCLSYSFFFLHIVSSFLFSFISVLFPCFLFPSYTTSNFHSGKFCIPQLIFTFFEECNIFIVWKTLPNRGECTPPPFFLRRLQPFLFLGKWNLPPPPTF